MVDVFPVDYTSAVGRVRKYVPDVRQVDNEFVFTDEELQSFIDDQGIGEPSVPSLLRAAAWAMIALANDENLILKKIKTEDLETDGPAVADKLLKSAALLFARANDMAELTGEEELFISVDYAPAPPRRQPFHNPFYRNRGYFNA